MNAIVHLIGKYKLQIWINCHTIFYTYFNIQMSQKIIYCKIYLLCVVTVSHQRKDKAWTSEISFFKTPEVHGQSFFSQHMQITSPLILYNLQRVHKLSRQVRLSKGSTFSIHQFEFVL